MRKSQHVVPYSTDWAVKGTGNSRVTSVHDTQAKAYEVARQIAINNRSEVVTHRPDGKIRDKDSFGRDPFPPRDKRY